MPQNEENAGDPSNPSEDAKIHTDEVKQKHTTHWDRDYLSTEELERAHEEGRRREEGED